MQSTLNVAFTLFSCFLFHVIFTIRLRLLLTCLVIDCDSIFAEAQNFGCKTFHCKSGKKSKNRHFVERGISAQLPSTAVTFIYSK